MTNNPTLPPGLDMEYRFSAHETAELAAEVEEKGAAFYRRLAAEVHAGTIRDMCVFFAGQEENHRRTFRTIAEHFRKTSAEFLYSVDIRAMLRTSLEAIVRHFSHHGSRVLNGGGVMGCLNLSRLIEETSVAVYGHMRRTYTSWFSDVLAMIVAEEEEHLRMVRKVLNDFEGDAQTAEER